MKLVIPTVWRVLHIGHWMPCGLSNFWIHLMLDSNPQKLCPQGSTLEKKQPKTAATLNFSLRFTKNLIWTEFQMKSQLI